MNAAVSVGLDMTSCCIVGIVTTPLGRKVLKGAIGPCLPRGVCGWSRATEARAERRS
jgi:hypothetical protein